jgi:pimeloyl-ACP methyl ester carboxylesterase
MANFRSPGCPLYYESNGTGEPALLFVHGYCRSHEDWDKKVDYFRSGHRVAACDLPGHGKSDCSLGQVSIEGFAASVAETIGAVRFNPVVLIGHSMGCRVVLQTYFDRPQDVVGLILIDGSWCSAANFSEMRARVTADFAELGYQRFLQREFEEMFVATSDPLLKRRIVTEAMAMPRPLGEPLLLRTLEWDAAHMEDALSRIAVPLLILQSTALNVERRRVMLKEGETTPWLELVRKLVPAAQTHVLPGIGHFSMLEAPSQINRAIEQFVARQ